MTTDVQTFISELGAGVTEQALSAVLSDVAGAVVDHHKQGKVSLEMTFKQVGNPNGDQVAIAAKLKFSRPTARGNKSEEDTIETVMYVGSHGKLSQFPENQLDAFRNNTSQPQKSHS